MSILRSLRMPHEVSATEALDWFKKSIFMDIPPYFMTHWKTGKQFFYGGDALIAYEETTRHLVIAGEPLVAAGSDEDEIYYAFNEFAKRKQKKICGYYVSKKWNWHRFFKVPIGKSVRILLEDFDIQSSEAKEVRRSLRRGLELKYETQTLNRKQRLKDQGISKLYSQWKTKKLPFSLKFFLSEPLPKNTVDSYEEWFVVKKEGEILAFCSLLPYLRDGDLGFYVDHLIYNPRKEPHALSYLISFLIEILKEEGVSELHLGLNPFAYVDRKSLAGKLFKILYYLPFLDRPNDFHFFRKKFTGIEEKEYCFFQRKKSKWMGLADRAKITFIKSGQLI